MNRERYAFFLLRYYHIHYLNFLGSTISSRRSLPLEEFYRDYFNGSYLDSNNLIQQIIIDIGPSSRWEGTKCPMFPIHSR